MDKDLLLGSDQGGLHVEVLLGWDVEDQRVFDIRRVERPFDLIPGHPKFGPGLAHVPWKGTLEGLGENGPDG